MPDASNPIVSFVVPCYNYGRFLPDCLQSILQQEGGYDFEIVAVDDASTDNTLDVLRDFDCDRLRIIRHSRNLGHVATINEGLTEARGSFIARIDPDDRYRSYFLLAAMDKFSQFPEVGLVYGDAAVIDSEGRINVERSDRSHGGSDFRGNELIRLMEDNIICAPTVIARREAWQQALPAPEGLAFNDWYFNLMISREFDFYYIDRVLADYRVHAANHHTKIIRDKSEEASIFYLLQRLFSEKEKDSNLQEAKERGTRRVYSKQYLTLAEKYFGSDMNADARRCYLKAIRNRPSYLLKPGIQRRLAATVFGRQPYEFSKALVKSVLS